MKITTEIEIEIEDPPSPPEHHEWKHWGYGHKSNINSTYARYTQEFGWIVNLSIEPNGITTTYYLEAVLTHREDGVPIGLSPFPTMPDHVERLEYHGTHMKPEDMGDADNYIIFTDGNNTKWCRLDLIKATLTDKEPSGGCMHYAKVYYKKEKPAPTAPLPEFEGWKHDISKGKWGLTKEEAIATNCDGVSLWSSGFYGKFKPQLNWYYGVKNQFYVPAYKVTAKPAKTELSDLIGEDGQKIAYVINDTGDVAPFELSKYCDKWEDSECSREELICEGWRWSHSPFTAYADANPFIFE